MIVFVTEQPYTFNLSGADALSSAHLRFLREKYPEDIIHVVFLGPDADFWKEQPDFDLSRILLTPIRAPKARLRPLGPGDARLFWEKRLDVLAKGIFGFEPDGEKVLGELGKLFRETGEIRFIMCEHLMPLLYLSLVLPEEFYRDKVVYSHHDFMFKILSIRSSSWRHLLRSWLLRRLEKRALGRTRYFVSGSQHESRLLREFSPGARNIALLPCFYPALPSRLAPSAASSVRIYHLGTMSATANRVGIRFFLRTVFPAIEHLPFTLEFIGNVKEFILGEFPHLADHPKVVFHGFVPDLEKAICPGMIHIVPYSGMTGTRTRVAGIARFAPCLLGFKTIQDSYPFLENRRNAMIASTEADFAAMLEELITDGQLRSRISSGVMDDFAQYERKLLSEARFTDHPER